MSKRVEIAETGQCPISLSPGFKIPSITVKNYAKGVYQSPLLQSSFPRFLQPAPSIPSRTAAITSAVTENSGIKFKRAKSGKIQ